MQQVEHEHGTVDPVAGAEGRVVPVAVAEDRVGVTGAHRNEGRVEVASVKKRVGRPRKTPSNVINQPAIHRFSCQLEMIFQEL